MEHDIDAAAVLQTGIHHRAALVDAPSHGRSDALADIGHVLRVAELDVRQRDAPAFFDEHLVRAVHHDVGDTVIVQQRL